MFRKVKKYDKTHIDLCRNCAGEGIVAASPPASSAPRPCSSETCSVCGGSGRVRKTTRIEVTIEPLT
jgi:DnaJ-class molecular chaperone